MAQTLPSQFQIGDSVWLNLGISITAKVYGVHFSESKVRYDLIVTANDVETQIESVDSNFVMPI